MRLCFSTIVGLFNMLFPIRIRFQEAGRYTWSDGSTVIYTFWGSGNPDLSGGGCARHSKSLSGQWVESSCDGSYGAICKIVKSTER